MTEHTPIKTRADGSIDTAHYMARGRRMRSVAFLTTLGKLCRPSLGAGRLPARKDTDRSRTAVAPHTVPAE